MTISPSPPIEVGRWQISQAGVVGIIVDAPGEIARWSRKDEVVVLRESIKGEEKLKGGKCVSLLGGRRIVIKNPLPADGEGWTGHNIGIVEIGLVKSRLLA
jgi:hypothetical protein